MRCSELVSRRRRIKCDEGHPCQACLTANSSCTFEEPGKRRILTNQSARYHHTCTSRRYLTIASQKNGNLGRQNASPRNLDPGNTAGCLCSGWRYANVTPPLRISRPVLSFLSCTPMVCLRVCPRRPCTYSHSWGHLSPATPSTMNDTKAPQLIQLSSHDGALPYSIF